ncbi:MAG: 1,4-alpha-glucan branching protein domain-containing protein [Syntrophorhabdales bacterium]
MPEGYVVLVLHAHLPYVLSHGKWPHGSDWLCEAASETYIPLLNLLGSLSATKRSAHFTVGITPVLCEMLASPLFTSEFQGYLGEKLQAAERDRRTFEDRGEGEMAFLAAQWQRFYESRLADFRDVYRQNLLAAFRQFQEEGQIEIIVSAATHAYLPLLRLDSSINAQIGQGVATYRKHFSREPAGMWLPECAYRPESVPPEGRPRPPVRRGLEAFLAAHHLKYFFVDGRHLLGQPENPAGYAAEVDRGLSPEGAAQGSPGMYRDRIGGARVPLPAGEITQGPASTEESMRLYAIHRTGRPGSETAFFTRDTDTSQQVWSAGRGYPGDPYYLEFHKKRNPGGLRYWRVTDRLADLGSKKAYEPDKAGEKVQEHARHFAGLVQEKLSRYHQETGRTGVLTLPFDAELFGHWWFEGPAWLGALVSAFDESCVIIEKASTALENVVPLGTIGLPEGSWGEGGLHLIWQNKETAWTWRWLYEAERDMERLVRKAAHDEASERLLKQMARELFLLQSSDWQFLISTKTAGDYGKSRFLGHYHAYRNLGSIFDRYRKRGALSDRDRQTLRLLEKRDALFDNVQLEWFKERTEDGL